MAMATMMLKRKTSASRPMDGHGVRPGRHPRHDQVSSGEILLAWSCSEYRYNINQSNHQGHAREHDASSPKEVLLCAHLMPGNKAYFGRKSEVGAKL